MSFFNASGFLMATNTYLLLSCAVPEKPNITRFESWVDEEAEKPQPVIYIEWTVGIKLRLCIQDYRWPQI